jgi:hypothetical protein
MATNIQNLITNLEETIAYLKTQLPKEEVVVKTDKKKAPAKKAEPKEKNLNRMTPAIKTELTKILKTHSIELTEELRKEFIEFVNSMETDAYAASNLTTHMETFAKSKSTVVEEQEEVNDEPLKNTIQSQYAGQQDPPDLSKLSNAAASMNLHSMMRLMSTEAINALKKTEILKPLGNRNYWYPKDGVYVFEDTDDDLKEIKFKGNTYVVNPETKRVYETTDDRDIFVGFLGIGDFKTMKV